MHHPQGYITQQSIYGLFGPNNLNTWAHIVELGTITGLTTPILLKKTLTLPHCSFEHDDSTALKLVVNCVHGVPFGTPRPGGDDTSSSCETSHGAWEMHPFTIIRARAPVAISNVGVVSIDGWLGSAYIYGI